MLRAVDYALASTPDSDSEELDKPSDNEKDEPFTEAVDQHDILEVTTGNIVVVLYELRKKVEIFRGGSKYSKRLCLCSVFKT